MKHLIMRILDDFSLNCIINVALNMSLFLIGQFKDSDCNYQSSKSKNRNKMSLKSLHSLILKRIHKMRTMIGFSAMDKFLLRV